MEEIASGSTPFSRAVKTLVFGIEVKLLDDARFRDFSGHQRREVRIAWWRNDANPWRGAALSVPDPLELPGRPLPANIQSEIYDGNGKPVFVGHYKIERQSGARAAERHLPRLPADPLHLPLEGRAHPASGEYQDSVTSAS